MCECQILSKRMAHLSGDIGETDGLLVPRRRAFSLSFGMSGGASQRPVVTRESPLVLKSSSVSSVTSRQVDDPVICGDTWQPVVGQWMSVLLSNLNYMS